MSTLKVDLDVRFWREKVVLNRSRKGTLYFRSLNPNEKKRISKGFQLENSSVRTWCSISTVNKSKDGKKYTEIVRAYSDKHCPDVDKKEMGKAVAQDKAMELLTKKINIVASKK